VSGRRLHAKVCPKIFREPSIEENYTTYVAGVVTAAGAPDGGAAFIRFVTSPAAKSVFAATGAQ